MDVKILSFPEFKLLHDAVMRWPEGSAMSALDPSAAVLIEAGFVKQKGVLFYPTDAGVNHIAPARLRQKKKLN